jgi:DNA-binding MarR family transcriptional regulator
MIGWALDGADLINEIVAAGERIAAARTWADEPIFRRDALWLLVCALERATYCCSISDAARLMRVTRQTAHELAVRAQLAGYVDLMGNPDDRRIIQLFLTPAARKALARARAVERSWITVLLNGLDAREMRATTHVVNVIRRRLEREEREQRATRSRSGRSRGRGTK